MTALTHDDLKRLATTEDRGCVSIYVPAHLPRTHEGRGPTALKNLRAEAERQLIARGFNPVGARELLGPIDDLVNDETFWRGPIEGLAVFVSSAGRRIVRLNHPVGASAWVGRHFHLKPLWSEAEAPADHFALVVNQHGATLYRGDCQKLEPVPGVRFPASLREAAGGSLPDKVGQAHSANPQLPGKQGAVFHGQGDQSDWHKPLLVEYLREVDRAAVAAIGRATAPLVFVGVDYLFPIYRELTSLGNLWPAPVYGNAQSWSGDELHRRVLDALGPHLAAPRQADVRQFDNGQGGDRVSASVEEIVHAAAIGQVEAAFVAGDVTLWGTYDAATGAVEFAPQPIGPCEDLLDRIAAHTFLYGGRVHVVPAAEIPGGLIAAAVYRYPRVAAATAVGYHG